MSDNTAENRSPLAICLLGEPSLNAPRTVSYSHYIEEILNHFGLWYETIPEEDLAAIPAHIKILVTIGEKNLSEAARGEFKRWLQQGGAWLSIAGLCGMEDFWGLEKETPAYQGCNSNAFCALGEGYLQIPEASHIVCEHLSIPLHFFNGLAVQPSEGKANESKRCVLTVSKCADRHGRLSARVAIAEQVGEEGHALFIAPDLVGAVIRIQQGVAITRDGVPSSEGTAIVSDGWCKSDDGTVLDWDFDRVPVPGVPGLKGFLNPIADEWRELLLRSILYLARSRKVALPLLWFYPRNLPALGHVSHDTDHNDPRHAQHLLRLLECAEIHSTWCVILPGYSPELIEAIRAAGHELATHYDAISEGCLWSEAQFDAQWKELTNMFGQRPVTNKNHYLRWEGDTEFLEWCKQRGIELDQTKGTSKVGEVGYIFGSCHPYRCVAPDGRIVDILELATQTADLEVFAPEDIFEPLLNVALRNYGVLHLLFHPDHTHKPQVEAAFIRSIAAAKAAGLEFWTAQEINEWERIRRKVEWRSLFIEEGVARLHVESPEVLPGATWLLTDAGPKALAINDGSSSIEKVQRWGFDFLVNVATV
jgi:hypothetical protein